jgi:pyridoxal phosphate enzyme (YggS family)
MSSTAEQKMAVAGAVQKITKHVSELARAAGRADCARLVAVSKTKPVDLCQAVFDAGHRHFGENYVQEFVDKAPLLPKDIKWHFIGHLQSNKCKKLVSAVPNLFMVETVDGAKLARKLNAAAAAAGRDDLRILVQVNTTGEAAKSGVTPEECAKLARFVVDECSNLRFAGLMTIGAYGDTSPKYFEALRKCKEDVIVAIGDQAVKAMPDGMFELSMGMSGDYPLAIERGSTNVRVGSSIFGARNYGGGK